MGKNLIGGRGSLVFVITFGVFLLALFGALLPLMVGKFARIYKEHRDLAMMQKLKEKAPQVQFLKPSPPALERRMERKSVKPEVKAVQKGKADTVDKRSMVERDLHSKKETKEASTGLLPSIPEVTYVIPSLDGDSSRENGEREGKSSEAISYVILPRTFDLKKTSRGAFPIEIRLTSQNGRGLKPQIMYWVGTGDATGYIDMESRGGGVWRYEIPDQGWAMHRSQFLFYRIRIVNSGGGPMFEGQVERELIDSFDNDSFDNG